MGEPEKLPPGHPRGLIFGEWGETSLMSPFTGGRRHLAGIFETSNRVGSEKKISHGAGRAPF